MTEVVEYYNKIADIYDADRFDNTYGRFIDSEERAWLRQMGVGADTEQTLEIACGTGRLTDFADVGIDAGAEMLAIARKKHPNKQFYIADARDIDLPDASFDTIYSFHLMMHLQLADIKAVVAEAWRLLKPGGRFIFDIPSAQRRRLLRHDCKGGWHGATALTLADVKEIAARRLDVKLVGGIMFLPVHKLPVRMRMNLVGVDKVLCRSVLKPYCSYLLFELRKL